jgi:NAD(P)-dependent dehydrogenase (short-subunit alcohol dehydrogenase family)
MENSPDFWRKVIDLNLLGPVLVTHAFLGGMIARGRGGKVVTVASDAGRVGSSGETVYSGAKGGAIAFGKALAREMARYKINVNSVCPGPTDTPGSLRQGHPDAPARQAEGDRRRGAVLRQQRLRLHHRPGAERQRWHDHGRLNAGPLPLEPWRQKCTN